MNGRKPSDLGLLTAAILAPVSAPCECEHIAHLEPGRYTPNGNPGHKYGQRFVQGQLTPVKTDCGTFKVCPSCKVDCLQHYIKEPAT